MKHGFAVVLLAGVAGVASLGASWDRTSTEMSAEQPGAKAPAAANAAVVVVGTVTEVWESREGARTRYKGLIRVHKSEKGTAKTGETVEATWWMTRAIPGAEQPGGHHAEFVRPGRVVRVTMAKTGDVKMPDGLELVAEPIYVTDDLLKGRDVAALRAAADRATKIGAHDEASNAWERVVERADSITEIEHRLRWAESLRAGRRFIESAQAAMPAAVRKSNPPPPEPGQKAEVTPAVAARILEAREAVLAAYWDADDLSNFWKSSQQFATTDNTPALWNRLKAAAVKAKNKDVEKRADEALKALAEKKP